jgi:hypothetical protein
MSHILAGAYNTTVNDSNLYSIAYDQSTINVYSGLEIGELLILRSFPPTSASTVTRVLMSIIQSQLDKELRVVLDWLSPLNFKVSQSAFLGKRENGTGKWLLESQEYKAWRDGTGELLWCRGDRESTSRRHLASQIR